MGISAVPEGDPPTALEFALDRDHHPNCVRHINGGVVTAGEHPDPAAIKLIVVNSGVTDVDVRVVPGQEVGTEYLVITGWRCGHA